jgi:sterol desaturase/sphingolipid hydroxylase (fatty acid hydroxylase superfamily)
VLWDLWQYWLHRLQHTVPFLWQTHRFHHTETALNATSQTRHHFLSYLLSVIFYLPMLVIFGGQSPPYLAAFVMFRLWGFVNHANVRLNIGLLTPIISGPQWHRIHHSKLLEHQNRNFATFFPFIDVVFGTYYCPRKDEYPVTGLIEEVPVKLLREATIAPFVACYQASLTKLDKLKIYSRRLIFKPTPRDERRS